MPINYAVQAEVVDIQSDMPSATDAFLVDSNVWFWLAYTRASSAATRPQPHQLANYPAYLRNALSAKAKLLRSGISLAELAHQIERAEREIYELTNAQSKPATFRAAVGWLRPKEFRHNLVHERATVVNEVQTAWAIVRGMAKPLPLAVNDETTDAALVRFQTQPLDGYDLFILEAMKASGIVQVITDDGDYCTVPAIRLFTSNKNVLSAASSQGKLVVR